MERKTNLRALRHQYNIYLPELSTVSGLSQQYISQAELGQIIVTPRLERQLEEAVDTVIAQRYIRLNALEQSFAACKGRLLQPAEGDHNE